jgi:hypothetical protein
VSSAKTTRNPAARRAGGARLGLLALVAPVGTDYYAEMLTRTMIMAILP